MKTISMPAMMIVSVVLLLNSTVQAERKGMMLSTLNLPQRVVSDVQSLAALGADIVRFPMYFDSNYIPSLDHWLNMADIVLAECERLGVVMVIDYHAQIVDVNDFVNKWKAFAQRFKNRGGLWYDLCNEPNHPDWRNVALRAARAIRQIDSQHPIVFSPKGVTTAAALDATPLPGISNQILQFHFYDWGNVQFHPYSPTGDTQVTPYPSPNRNKEDLRRLIARVREARERTGVPVYIGEVAISREHPNAARFLRDFTSICDEMNIHLTVHAFREADIWNYEASYSAWVQIMGWLAS